ncbi:MAG: branched-chain amino acid transaminase [Acidobacteria bacterium]|nr:branched-chain amino acid transaminase [Acidobacteriota bacterium]
MAIQPTDYIWLNGRLVRWDDARIHTSIHTLHYGSGVFEGIRCYATDRGGAVFRLRAHMERLFRSAAAYSMLLPYPIEALEAAILGLIKSNRLNHGYIRPIAYHGAGSLNLLPRDNPVEVAVMVWPWASYLGDENITRGVRAAFSSWVKFHASMFPAAAKGSGQYVNSTLAVREAVGRGFDEAILVNQDGSVCEGSGENIFLVRRGEVITNGLESNILMGITRDSVLTIARDLGYEASVRPFFPDELLSADEAFFTGTAAEVTPIRQIDDRIIGSGARGPVTKRLQSVFFDTVNGRAERYADWLTFV